MVQLRQLESQLRVLQVQQIPQADRENKHASITRGEIDSFPADVRVYHGVGRMCGGLPSRPVGRLIRNHPSQPPAFFLISFLVSRFVMENKVAALARIDGRMAAAAAKKEEMQRVAASLEKQFNDQKIVVQELIRTKAK
jgi:hypothetical protein